MTIQIGDYEFEGPFDDIDNIKDDAGIYAIICKDDPDNYTVIDIGESGEMKTRLADHDRRNCWEKYCDNISYAVYYMPDSTKSDRTKIEQGLRDLIDPVCGER